MFATPSQVSILTVSKLNRFAKRVLESEIGLVWVSGEISNFVAASSGHWYFTLKDSQAQVRTAMFKGANQKAGFKPKAGDKVVVRANISLYEPRGDYQLIAQHIEPEGIGQLKQAYEALKAQLQSEGLFDQALKKPLPSLINKVGVVTSSTGAAIHDILHVLGRRNPAIEVIIYPSLVQGDQAAQSIARQISIANQRKEVDILIVGRGGGSLEDLWPFNEELVARAIFASTLPVVSAVGHEVDVTIADFVADMRAPTPSAAAENISTDSVVLKRGIEQAKQRLHQALRQKLIHNEQRLDIAQANLKSVSVQRNIDSHHQQLLSLQKRLATSHPQTNINLQLKYNSELLGRLLRSGTSQIHQASQRQKHAIQQIKQCNPSEGIKQRQRTTQQLLHSLLRYQRELFNRYESELASKASLLQSVSPLATLSRGYSITYKNEDILLNSQEVNIGDKLYTKLSDGQILSQVLEKTESTQ